MKRWLLLAFLPICLGCQVATEPRAKAPTFEFAYANFVGEETRSSIEEATTTADLAPFLEDPSAVVRIAAVRRIADMGNTEAIPLLVRTFHRQPRAMGHAEPLDARAEIVSAMGKIGGRGARKAVARILKEYWRRGPRTERIRGDGGDPMCVMYSPLGPGNIGHYYCTGTAEECLGTWHLYDN